MTIWSKIFGGSAQADSVDYYEEALALADEGKFHEALTSLRLALRELPGDPVVLQQIAITYTRVGMDAEAVKTYKHVLLKHPQEPGAHYGLAFLLLRDSQGGDKAGAIEHLEAFMEVRPTEEEAKEHVAHAEETLERLRAETDTQEQEGDNS